MASSGSGSSSRRRAAPATAVPSVPPIDDLIQLQKQVDQLVKQRAGERKRAEQELAAAQQELAAARQLAEQTEMELASRKCPGGEGGGQPTGPGSPSFQRPTVQGGYDKKYQRVARWVCGAAAAPDAGHRPTATAAPSRFGAIITLVIYWLS